MCRFYSGLTPEKCFEMPIEFFNSMWQAITILEAQEQLENRAVAAWPHISQADRNRIHKDLFTKAYPATMKGETPVTTKDLFSRLQGLTGKG